ncbi:MAG: 16S rRNA (cytosine(1402)-N(4))-methyltransferase RsmH [Candidatus Promineifilaceae bacterium]|nr:16S rRNA (cytosine(1402)-N(4))-methyltransferase RsmH [Candidatus Promineifilaceae bacterium]
MEEHVPVLYQEVLDLLRPTSRGRYVDGTVGAGGHSAGILAASAPDGQVLAIDRDAEALRFARERLAPYGERVDFVQGSYADMALIARMHDFVPVDGVLLDLGLSSRQLADAERGFSFMTEGPLDMRFDQTAGRTAADLINNLSERALADILRRYGEVRQNRKLARAIVHERPFETTVELANLIEEQIGRRRRIHPATQVFQALRIAVNDELRTIEEGLKAAVEILRPGGRMAVISFHSLEDRIVKHFIREEEADCICPPSQPLCTCDKEQRLQRVNRKIIRPDEAEVEANPRSRSARLRVAEKVETGDAG